MRRVSEIFYHIVFVLLIAGVGGYYVSARYLPSKNGSQSEAASRVERQVVILQSGQTYYAESIEEEGEMLSITVANGASVTVPKKDILQISKAVIDN